MEEEASEDDEIRSKGCPYHQKEGCFRLDSRGYLGRHFYGYGSQDYMGMVSLRECYAIFAKFFRRCSRGWRDPVGTTTGATG